MQMKTDNQTSNQLLGGGLLFVVVEGSGKRTRVHVLLSVVMLAYDDNLLTALSKLSTEERQGCSLVICACSDTDGFPTNPRA